QADLLLGSFFFIHQSNANDCDEHSSANDMAFEFLHNTFGEFLTADFILQSVREEVEALHYSKGNKKSYQKMEQDYSKADGLTPQWYACLMYTPLYSRPVIPQMIREWSSHLFNTISFDKSHFTASFDVILNYQLKLFLHTRTLPVAMKGDAPPHFADMPLFGLIATYTLNLIILRTIIDPNCYVFDETIFSLSEDDSTVENSDIRPWDRLTLLWRSWFTIESLSELSAILSATRKGNKVTLKCQEGFKAKPNSDRLETVYTVALTLADDITTGLSGLQLQDGRSIEPSCLGILEACLDQENIDLTFEFLLRQLRIYLNKGRPVDNIEEMVYFGLERLSEYTVRDDQAISFITMVTIICRRGVGSSQFWEDMQPWVIKSHQLIYMMAQQPAIGIAWLRLIQACSYFNWFENYCKSLVNAAMRSISVTESVHLSYRVEWLEFLQKTAKTAQSESLFETYCVDIFESDWSKEREQLFKTEPLIAIEWIAFILPFGRGHKKNRIVTEFLVHGLRPQTFMTLLAQHPMVAQDLLKQLQNSKEWLQGLTNVINAMKLDDIAALLFRKSQDCSLCLLQLLHLLKLDNSVILICKHYGKHKFNVARIPLAFINNLYWYAQVTNDEELLHQIKQFTNQSQ
ncbi:MAG: hypothetical protein HRT35_37895, partial [Algicola sp.]|nr:hypothetical protein [Algicola sp.]